jgi:hypothetical protein
VNELMNFFKKLFCYHKWEMVGKPYLWDAGTTKRVDVRCVKCGRLSNVDIFSTSIKRWAARDDSQRLSHK